MAYCTKCGKEINGKKFCEHCNTKKNNRIHNFCKWCGTPLEAGSKICTACGEKKRDGNIIIKFISAVFGSIIIFYGIVNIMDSIPMAIVHILQGILFMPFMHNIFKNSLIKRLSCVNYNCNRFTLYVCVFLYFHFLHHEDFQL